MRKVSKMYIKFRIAPSLMSIILLMAMFVSIQSSSKSIVKCGSTKINIPEYAEDYQVVEIETRYYFMYMPVANAIFSK